MITWVNNQVFVVGLAQDHRHVRMASKEHLLKVWKTFALCRQSIKETCK